MPSRCARGVRLPTTAEVLTGGGRKILPSSAIAAPPAKDAEGSASRGVRPSTIRTALTDPVGLSRGPDFLTFYASATGAGLDRAPGIRPSRSARDGFSKKAPIGAGPYKFRPPSRPASSWCARHSRATGARHRPSKRLVFKVNPRRSDPGSRALAAWRDRYRLFDPRRAGPTS